MIESGRFAGRTALVTGAGGFIGGAVTDRASLQAAWPDAELVVHTAAHVREYGAMKEVVELNVGGTVNVLDAAAAHDAERVLHVSSVVIYGYDDRSDQGEAAFRRTYGIPYIDTKSASDRIACGRGAIVIRPGDVYGPGSSWVRRPIQLAKAGRLTVPGRGDGLMLPIYIDDLVEAVLLGLEAGKRGRPYAAWSGEPLSFRDYFDRYGAMAGTGPARPLPRPLRAAVGTVLQSVARLRGRAPMFTPATMKLIDRRGPVSTERIRNELGWRPEVGLEEGMRRVETWARAAGLF